MEGFVDSSGLFAVARHRDAASLTWLGLQALQARGTAGASVVASDGEFVRCHRGRGLVHEIVAASPDELHGRLAIGQVWGRGPADGLPAEALDPTERTVFARWAEGRLGIALSGRFTQSARTRRELEEAGALFQGPSDAELLAHLVARSAQRTFVNRLVDALWKIEGAYSLLVCTEDRLIAVRDPRGFRPLVLGRLDDAVLLASDDAALRAVGGEPRRELRPGEMIVIDARGAQSVQPFARRPGAACAQELVTIAPPDARLFGRDVHAFRLSLGARLAKDAPCPVAQVVVGPPGPGETLARGFARASGLPCEAGLVSSRAWGRAEASSATSDGRARLGLAAVPGAVSGRVVALVVPAVLTGQGIRAAVKLLRDAGAVAVHLRVATPPVRGACAYGPSGPTVDELLTSRPEAGPSLEADSVGAVTLEGLREVLGDEHAWCRACLDLEHPLPPDLPDDQLPLF